MVKFYGNGLFITNEQIDTFYKEHEQSTKDLLVDDKSDLDWFNDPSEVEHSSAIEMKYESSRHVLISLGLEDDESLKELEGGIKKTLNVSLSEKELEI